MILRIGKQQISLHQPWCAHSGFHGCAVHLHCDWRHRCSSPRVRQRIYRRHSVPKHLVYERLSHSLRADADVSRQPSPAELTTTASAVNFFGINIASPYQAALVGPFVQCQAKVAWNVLALRSNPAKKRLRTSKPPYTITLKRELKLVPGHKRRWE